MNPSRPPLATPPEYGDQERAEHEAHGALLPSPAPTTMPSPSFYFHSSVLDSALEEMLRALLPKKIIGVRDAKYYAKFPDGCLCIYSHLVPSEGGCIHTAFAYYILNSVIDWVVSDPVFGEMTEKQQQELKAAATAALAASQNYDLLSPQEAAIHYNYVETL